MKPADKRFGLFAPADLLWIHGVYLTLEECKICMGKLYKKNDYVIAEHTNECLKDRRLGGGVNCCIGIRLYKPASKEEIELLIEILEL